MNYIKQNHLSILIILFLVSSSLFGGSGSLFGARADLTTVTNPWTFSNSASDGGVTSASTTITTLKIGQNGTALTRVNSGFCNIKTGVATIAASSSIAVDCGGGSFGATALAGITVTDRVILGQPTTTPAIGANVGTGLQVLGASASTTAGFITVILFNGTGGIFTWTAAASSSWPYVVAR